MGTEIERKFLFTGMGSNGPSVFLTLEVIHIVQGYLHSDPQKSVRIRTKGSKGELTIKFGSGMTRPEFDYNIPLEDAQAMLRMCDGFLVTKNRHVVVFEGMTWEVDVFQEHNEGLTIAEIELTSEDQQFALPPWVGLEVTHDPRYLNANLASTPFKSW